MEAKRQETFKLLERKGFPLRILYPFKLLIKCEAVIKIISDRQNTLRITAYHKKQLKDMLKQHLAIKDIEQNKDQITGQTQERGERKPQ